MSVKFLSGEISFDFDFLFNQLLIKSSRTLVALPSLVLHQEVSQTSEVLLVWLIKY